MCVSDSRAVPALFCADIGLCSALGRVLDLLLVCAVISTRVVGGVYGSEVGPMGQRSGHPNRT